MAAVTRYADGRRHVAVTFACAGDCGATHTSLFSRDLPPGSPPEALRFDDDRRERSASVDAIPEARDEGWRIDTDGSLLCGPCGATGGA